MSALLRASGLACRRGGRVLFSGIDFALCAGDAMIVRGPNGSGKTSLLRLLAGLGRPAEGSITRTARIGWLGHDNGLKSSLSVRDNLQFWINCQDGSPDMGSALEQTGLKDLDRLPLRLLSAGQKRRAAIARLLLTDAPVWLLDEPTVGLDDASVNRFRELMAAHRAGGGGIIATTHIPLGLDDARVLEMAG